MNIIKRFRALPVGAKRLMGLGSVFALFVALPLFVRTITTQTFNLAKRAQDIDSLTGSCGGACGSVYNCGVNLFCHQGFCRNPDCPTDTTCECKTTPTPLPTVATTKEPIVKPSPTPTAVPTSSPTPTQTPSLALAISSPTSMSLPTATPTQQPSSSENSSFLLWIAGGTFATAIILILFAL